MKRPVIRDNDEDDDGDDIIMITIILPIISGIKQYTQTGKLLHTGQIW
jgi:hypothetical protein